MFLATVIGASALTYPNVGHNDFIQGTGFFNNEASDVESNTRAIGRPSRTPLVADLDGDGVNEIIVMDAGNVRLYHGHDLTTVDAFNINGSTAFANYSNMIAFNIDSDNYTELIVVSESVPSIDILEYNGTAFYAQRRLPVLSFAVGQGLIGCRAANECLLLTWEHSRNSGAEIPRLFMNYFNSTNVTTFVISDTLSMGQLGCFPLIRTMAIADYDKDGDTEFVASSLRIQPGSVEEFITIDYFTINVSNGVPRREFRYQENDTGNLVSSTDLGCDGVATIPSNRFPGRYFTPPIVFDVDGSPGNGLETVMAYMPGTNTSRMSVYNRNGVVIDTHPGLESGFAADSNLIGDVFRANAFDTGDTTRKDYCVLGQKNSGTELDLLCGSQIHTTTFLFSSVDSVEFDAVGLSRNLSYENYSYNIMTHSAQHTTVLTSGNNLDEIITGYGVLRLDYGVDNVLTTIFTNPIANGTLSSIDVEGVGRDDLLALSPTNLWYLDDGYTNSPGVITSFTVNPCLDTTWKQNTTVGVTIKVEDVDSNTVGARAVLYQGSPYEKDSNWSINASSGTTFSFTFVANQTIGTAVLQLLGRDTFNPSIIDEKLLTFSVGSTGAIYGDCVTTQTFDLVTDVTVSDSVNLSQTPILGNNSVRNFVADLNIVTGLGSAVLWYLLMVFVAVMIWINTDHPHHGLAFGLIAFVETALFMIGALLGFIGTGTVIVMVVIGLAVIGLFARRLLFGGSD